MQRCGTWRFRTMVAGLILAIPGLSSEPASVRVAAAAQTPAAARTPRLLEATDLTEEARTARCADLKSLLEALEKDFPASRLAAQETIDLHRMRDSLSCDPANISGSWEGDFGCVTFTQTQLKASGEIIYTNGNRGRFDGDIKGAFYAYKWSNATDGGDGQMILTNDKLSGYFRTKAGQQGNLSFTKRNGACPEPRPKGSDCFQECMANCKQFGVGPFSTERNDQAGCAKSCTAYQGLRQTVEPEGSIIAMNICTDMVRKKQ